MVLTFKDVSTIFLDKCYMCHNNKSYLPNWTDYNTAYQYRYVIKDRVWIKRDMPLVGTMTIEEREKIKNWIDSGARK